MQSGQLIGQYQIVEPLGQGAMAAVYKAYHPRLNRHVAIKLIHKAHLSEHNSISRFEREAQIVAGLEHPNIVPVYDFAEHEGRPYLVLKLVEGCTLKELLRDGALSLADIMDILPPLADALDYAHAQGILHRDIKPSNIILDLKGTPYLTDFGLARLVASGESTMSKDMLLGTPNYISPEQAKGDQELDKRSDLYSFGCVLYELLVGKVPFSSGTPMSVLHDHIYRPLPQPSTVNPQIPAPVEAVLLRSLAKDPDDRYQSAAQMMTALSQAIEESKLIEIGTEPRQSVEDTLARLRAKRQQETLPRQAAGSSAPTPLAATGRARRVLMVAGIIVVALAAAVLLLIRIPRNASDKSTGIELYDVPILPIDQARTAVAQETGNPAIYLALARAELEAGNQASAIQTLLEGGRHTNDPVRYWLTVGTGAVANGRLDVAFSTFREALLRAESTENYPEVRAYVGEQLYNAASVASLIEPGSLRNAYSTFQREAPVPLLLETMYARALMTYERYPLAESTLNSVLSEAPSLAEALLVRGELFAAANRDVEAQRAWVNARAQEDAPEWVQQRAAELIESS
jgi:tRNA A-37 threonylcarbamoyl transferase component Bud32